MAYEVDAVRRLSARLYLLNRIAVVSSLGMRGLAATEG